MSTGLKGQWGVGDPAKAGSDRQSQQFQASFQREVAGINGHLQYTAANADAPRHDPLAARRDVLYPAFQSALAQIDRTNPDKAAGAIAKVLADGTALNADAAALHQAAEKALNDWKARQPKYDVAVHQVEELEAWGDPKAPAAALRGLVDGIRTHTNQRTYAQAVVIVDQLVPKLKPVYEDYQKQKAAKPKYEQALAEQAPRLDALKGAERPSQPMKAKAGEADNAQTTAELRAGSFDFVGACDKTTAMKTAVDALDKLAKDPERAKFLADYKAVEDLLSGSAGADLPYEIRQLDGTWHTAADAGDYAGANKILADVKAKVAAYQKKKAYDDALAALAPQLTEAATSTYKPLKARLDDITHRKATMEAAAQKEDHAAALKLLNELRPKVEAFVADLKKIQQAEKDFSSARADSLTKVGEALSASQNYLSLQSERTALEQDDAAVNAAASAQDFERALGLLKLLSAKAELLMYKARYTKKAQEEFQNARIDSMPTLNEALFLSRDIEGLKSRRAALEQAVAAMDAAELAHDFDKALELLKDVKAKAAALAEKGRNLQQDREAFSDALVAVLPTLREALHLSRDIEGMKKRRAALVQAEAAMDAAELAQDYEKAHECLKDVDAKATALVAKVKNLAQEKEEFSTAWVAVLPTLNRARSESFDVDALKNERAALVQAEDAVAAAEGSQDFETAHELLKDLNAKAIALLAKAKTAKQAQ